MLIVATLAFLQDDVLLSEYAITGLAEKLHGAELWEHDTYAPTM